MFLEFALFDSVVLHFSWCPWSFCHACENKHRSSRCRLIRRLTNSLYAEVRLVETEVDIKWRKLSMATTFVLASSYFSIGQVMFNISTCFILDSITICLKRIEFYVIYSHLQLHLRIYLQSWSDGNQSQELGQVTPQSLQKQEATKGLDMSLKDLGHYPLQHSPYNSADSPCSYSPWFWRANDTLIISLVATRGTAPPTIYGTLLPILYPSKDSKLIPRISLKR